MAIRYPGINIGDVTDLQSNLDAKLNKLFTGYTEDTAPALDDLVVINDVSSSNTAKKATLKSIGAGQLQADTTITIPYTYTASQIQAIIDAVPKNLNGKSLTLQFTNDSAKYLNNTAVVDLGDGTVKISCTAHGFVAGDVISIDGTTNYNGDYTLPAQTNGDADNFVITATYVAETPPTSAIARKPQIIDQEILINGFYGYGYINIKGNMSETGANTLHTTQQVWLKRDTDGMIFKSYFMRPLINFYNIKLQINPSSTGSSPIFSYGSNMQLLYSYCKGSSTTYGNGFDISYGGYGIVSSTYFEKFLYGMRVSSCGAIRSGNNDDYGTMPAYGLRAASGSIYKEGTQPSGSTANESKTGGGQIW